MHVLKDLFEQQIAGVIDEISDRDIQHNVSKNLQHYFSTGQSAIRCIRLNMLAAGIRNLRRILDLPCGHGRILRTIKAAFPDAQLTACDIDQDAVDFCARVFGATPVYSTEHPHEIQIEGGFDLIWCGSLLTHLDHVRWGEFIDFFTSLLTPGGILIFTTHGRLVASRFSSHKHTYGLAQDAIDEILEGYYRDGFGYRDYRSKGDYGISLSSTSWVCAQLAHFPNLRLINYTESGWNAHQDVVGCVRTKD